MVRQVWGEKLMERQAWERHGWGDRRGRDMVVEKDARESCLWEKGVGEIQVRREVRDRHRWEDRYWGPWMGRQARERHRREDSCVMGVAWETVMSRTCMDGETGAGACTQTGVVVQRVRKGGGEHMRGSMRICEFKSSYKYVIKLKITRVKTSIKAPTLGVTLFLVDFLNLWST
jgi:hypothetical protein